MSRHPLCLACNYPLTGLAEHRCPECGRAFDPADPRTFNDGRAVGVWARRMLSPTGFATIAILILAVGLLLALTGLPCGPWVPSSVELRFCAAEVAEAWDRGKRSPAELHPRMLAFLCGLALLVLGSAWWMARNALRWLVILARRPGRALRPRRPMRQALAALLVASGASLVLVGWPVRLARLAVDPIGLSPDDRALTPAETRALHRAYLIDLPRPADRVSGLHGFAQACDPADAAFVALLPEAIAAESDPAILAAELRLLSFFRDVRHGPLLERHAAHPSPEVRAAALDAIGILHAPAYPLNDGAFFPPELKVPHGHPDYGVNMGPLLKRRRPELENAPRGQRKWLDDAPIDLPAPRRALLERAMTAGATPDEREAAARALLRWTPPGHKLRYAEWGVWLAADDGLRPAGSVLEDVPPFVHRTGNPASHFGVPVYVAAKPVVHLTADRPMVVDLGVVLKEGRPWVAFPRPDDFLVDLTDSPEARSRLSAFDRPAPGLLTDLRAGYPFVTPLHQDYEPLSRPRADEWRLLTWGLTEIPVSTTLWPGGLGLRWQSLIVSPQKLPWMAEPPVPPEPRYAWWTRLPQVPASWVASRGEAERFLYYDGPVGCPPPATVRREGPLLLTNGSARPPDDAMLDVGWPGTPTPTRPADAPWPRRGLAVVVDDQGGGARAYEHEVPEGPRSRPLAAGPSLDGQAAPRRLAQMLVDHGLTPDETAALLACWQAPFFGRPGTRFLLIFGTRDYHHLSHLTLRPPPTTLGSTDIHLRVVWVPMGMI